MNLEAIQEKGELATRIIKLQDMLDKLLSEDAYGPEFGNTTVTFSTHVTCLADITLRFDRTARKTKIRDLVIAELQSNIKELKKRL